MSLDPKSPRNVSWEAEIEAEALNPQGDNGADKASAVEG